GAGELGNRWIIGTGNGQGNRIGRDGRALGNRRILHRHFKDIVSRGIRAAQPGGTVRRGRVHKVKLAGEEVRGSLVQCHDKATGSRERGRRRNNDHQGRTGHRTIVWRFKEGQELGAQIGVGNRRAFGGFNVVGGFDEIKSR